MTVRYTDKTKNDKDKDKKRVKNLKKQKQKRIQSLNQRLKLVTIFIILHLILNDLNKQDTNQSKVGVLMLPDLILLTTTMNMKTLTRLQRQWKQKNWNKQMKIKNGNRKPTKVKKHLKLFQLNKGNSSIDTFKDAIKYNVAEQQADVITLGEANIPRDDTSLKKDYPEYNSELLYLDGHDLARIVVLIKKGIIYERIRDAEVEDACFIMIKVKISRGKYVHIASIYRQWNLPSILRTSPEKCGLPGQLMRWNKILASIKQVSRRSIPLIIQGDLNIDQWQDNDPLSRNDIKQLNDILVDAKSELSLVQINHKPTRFQNGKNPSLLDLVLTDKPQNINCVETINSNVSDHKCVICQFHVKELQTQDQFFFTRNWKLINSSSLMQMIENNERLQDIFRYTDPETIATIIVEELNKIIDEIAPPKTIQIRGRDSKHKNEELEELKSESDHQLEKAINTGDRDEYRLYTRLKNKFQRKTKKFNEEQLKEEISDTKTMWKRVAEKLDKEKTDIPRNIVDGDKIVSSPIKLARLFMTFFKDKIKEIRKKFIEPKVDPITILGKLIPKPETSFDFRAVTIKETYEVINNMRGSNSRGFDYVTSKTLKQIPHMSSLWLTHLFNSMVVTNKFPKILKVTRILPILKPNKISTDKTSFRPIANLSVFEKVVEELMKRQLNEFFENENIILDNHHGGRKGYSTVTARAVIDTECSQIVERNNLGFVLTTDLSSAFDSVDTNILLKKLSYYGIGEKTNKLIESYLTERTEYTEINNRKSDLQEALPCSVVQGSKLSSLLYTIYTNEIPLLHNLMKDEEWMNKNLDKNVTTYSTTNHTTVNYIDDSSNIISFEEHTDAIHYLNDFFLTLKAFYNANLLCMNGEKTGLVCIARPQVRLNKDDIYIVEQPKNIVCKPQIRLLGWFLNERLSYDSTVYQNIGIVQNNINKLQSYQHLMTEHQRRMIANSHLKSKITYGGPLMLGQDEKVIQSIHKSQMTISRWIRGNYCFKESVESISRSVKWDTPNQTLIKNTAILMKKIIHDKRPAQLCNYIRFQRTRESAKLGKNFEVNTKYGKKTFSNHSINIYNILPDYMKQQSVEDFKKTIKTFRIEYKPD